MALSPEALLISSVLRERDYKVTVMGGMVPEMFSAYPEEWSWITRYYDRYKRTPTRNAFRTQFPKFPLKAVNDTAHYCDEVRKAYARRTLTRAMNESADALADGKVTDAAELLQQVTISVGATLNGVRDYDMKKDWQHVYDDVARRHKKYEETGAAGVPTGFTVYDERTGGLAPGQVTVVAARLSHGKSWALLYMAMNALMNGDSVHFASLEMSSAEVQMRLHNMLSGKIGKQVFQAHALQQGHGFDLGEYKSFLRGLKSTVKGNLTVSDTRNLGISEIAAHIEQHNPSVYYLDYLTLAKMRGEGNWKDIGDFTKALKDLSKEKDLAIVAAAQLNRTAENTKGMAGAGSVGGSDMIGQDADNLIVMKRRSATVTQYKAEKTRHARHGFQWWMQMDLSNGQFREMTKNDALDQIDVDKARDDEDEED